MATMTLLSERASFHASLVDLTALPLYDTGADGKSTYSRELCRLFNLGLRGLAMTTGPENLRGGTIWALQYKEATCSDTKR